LSWARLRIVIAEFVVTRDPHAERQKERWPQPVWRSVRNQDLTGEQHTPEDECVVPLGIRHYARVPLSRSEFLASLLETVPEAQPVVEEHLVDMGGELLLHLLMADRAFRHRDLRAR
jgi:hypothetical protein